VKTIRAEIERVSSGTSRAKTTVFTNRDLLKQASEAFIIVGEAARGLDRQAQSLAAII